MSATLTACFDGWDALDRQQKVARIKALFLSECKAVIDDESASLVLDVMAVRVLRLLKPMIDSAS